MLYIGFTTRFKLITCILKTYLYFMNYHTSFVMKYKNAMFLSLQIFNVKSYMVSMEMMLYFRLMIKEKIDTVSCFKGKKIS